MLLMSALEHLRKKVSTQVAMCNTYFMLPPCLQSDIPVMTVLLSIVCPYTIQNNVWRGSRYVTHSLLVPFFHVNTFCTTELLVSCCWWWSKNKIKGKVLYVLLLLAPFSINDALPLWGCYGSELLDSLIKRCENCIDITKAYRSHTNSCFKCLHVTISFLYFPSTPTQKLAPQCIYSKSE